jgi:hypothetical protein
MENFRKFSQVETFRKVPHRFLFAYFFRNIYVSGNFPEIFITTGALFYPPVYYTDASAIEVPLHTPVYRIKQQLDASTVTSLLFTIIVKNFSV